MGASGVESEKRRRAGWGRRPASDCRMSNLYKLGSPEHHFAGCRHGYRESTIVPPRRPPAQPSLPMIEPVSRREWLTLGVCAVVVALVILLAAACADTPPQPERHAPLGAVAVYTIQRPGFSAESLSVYQIPLSGDFCYLVNAGISCLGRGR